MSRVLDGKTAVVTGGSVGLGAAICKRLRAAGARVVIVDLQAPADSTYWYHQADVAEFGQLEAVFQAVGTVDILVNNAAIQPHGISLDETTPELLERVFRVNSHGVFYGIQLAGRHMRAGGSVINTSSFVGSIGVPNCPSYAASKASVDHLTRVGAIELASKGITVNAVAPGLVMTPAVMDIVDNPEIPFMEERIPLGYIPQPEEIVAVYEFLASDGARFITGAIIPVDAGATAVSHIVRPSAPDIEGFPRLRLHAPEF